MTEPRQSVETELRSLRESVNKLKCLLACLLFGLLTFVALAGLQPAKDSQTIEISRMVLKDRNHRTVAELTSNEAGLPRFKMFDTAGRSRLEFGLSDQDVGLFFADDSGNATISLSTVPGISSMISLNQPTGRRIDLSVAGGEPGEAEIEIGRESGPNDFALTILPKIHIMTLLGAGAEAKRGSRIALGTEDKGTAFMDFRDGKERERFTVESNPEGAVTLRANDAEEKALFKAP